MLEHSPKSSAKFLARVDIAQAKRIAEIQEDSEEESSYADGETTSSSEEDTSESSDPTSSSAEQSSDTEGSSAQHSDERSAGGGAGGYAFAERLGRLRREAGPQSAERLASVTVGWGITGGEARGIEVPLHLG